MQPHPTVTDIIQRLRGSRDWRQEQRLIEEALQQRNWGWLRELHAALLPLDGEEHLPARSLSREILYGFALTPGLEAARVAIALCRAQKDQARAVASRLGFSQAKDVLFAALDAAGDPDDEIFACWIHEHLFRNHMLQASDALRSFHARLIAKEHPLAELPLGLTALETDCSAFLPRYGKAGGAFRQHPSSFRSIPQPPSQPQAIPSGSTRSPLVSIGSLGFQEQAQAAIARWVRGSNGQVLVGIFATSQSTLDLGELIATGLECFPTCYAQFATATDAFAILFAAAAQGGAYGGGEEAAYGRLVAWQSLAALVGCELSLGFQAIEELAASCQWASFTSEWHHAVAWDLGLAALLPSVHLAVLAATDTD